ncbi:acyltransferase [Pseudomonas cichorii]|nr:acyltransferase family protein [Pseudomonas cichorii]MBX8489976.1 acyltransferase [Pseudomonas cichorii]MBX8559093.1 acyltransferase [Pseudomonas cichorii]
MGRIEQLETSQERPMTPLGRGEGFRSDINGLRAWAVMSVVLYHFGVYGFSGGFVGVDIFFVISGFLMVGIIFRGLEAQGRGWFGTAFRLSDFYLSRARRIVPALAVLCVFLALLGWLILFPVEYISIGKGMIAAIGFFSNWQFNKEFSYFDDAAKENFLLHTWSLSVEWQFYMLLPLGILLLWRLSSSRNIHAVVLFTGAIISFCISVMLSNTKPMYAFYMLPSRAWEMLLGGGLFLVLHNFHLGRLLRRWLEVLGYGLIILSVCLFDESTRWPGFNALLPVSGTLLILIAAQQDSIWSSNRVAQWLGNCSYSLYLWHWPIAVGLLYVQGKGNPWLVLFGIFLSIILGWLSFRFIEGPGRRFLSGPSRLFCSFRLLTVFAFVSLVGFLVTKVDTLYLHRLSEEAIRDYAEAKDVNPRQTECHIYGAGKHPECTYGGSKLGAIVIGDSHAGALVRAVENSLPDRNLHVLDWTYAACPTILDLKHVSDNTYRCGESVRRFLEKSHTLPASVPLIIINRLSVYTIGYNEPDLKIKYTAPLNYLTKKYESRSEAFLSEMREGAINTACEFAKDRPVYMVRPIPELAINVPKSMARGVLLGMDGRVSISLEEYRARQKYVVDTQDLAAARCGVKILDPIPYLCDAGRCRGDQGGLPIYFDDDHLSLRGANLLIPMFREAFVNE